jgi:hypothetical protein
VDVALGGLPFEEQAVERASPFEFAPGVALLTCSAEDLVVYKAFSSRTRDWLDLEGVMVRQGDSLDWDYIERELVPLCEAKEAPEIPGELRQLRQKLRQQKG